MTDEAPTIILTVKITPTMRGRLAEAAQLEDRSVSWLVRKALDEKLDAFDEAREAAQ